MFASGRSLESLIVLERLSDLLAAPGAGGVLIGGSLSPLPGLLGAGVGGGDLDGEEAHQPSQG